MILIVTAVDAEGNKGPSQLDGLGVEAISVRFELIVDDEPDVLDTLEDLLTTVDIVRAGDFNTARELLAARHFDLAILDIMGVNGLKLLEEAVAGEIPAVMLTAHALSAEGLVKSIQGGAHAYDGPLERTTVARHGPAKPMRRRGAA